LDTETDEIHETHSRVQLILPQRIRKFLEEQEVDPIEKKSAQHKFWGKKNRAPFRKTRSVTSDT
jgi:hypothetical protein